MPLLIFSEKLRILQSERRDTSMDHMNTGVSCGVTDCKFNRDGMHCELTTIHVGNTCDCEHCTCCDSFCKR